MRASGASRIYSIASRGRLTLPATSALGRVPTPVWASLLHGKGGTGGRAVHEADGPRLRVAPQDRPVGRYH